ncbi:site-specific integrase [Acinetobacter baumannii]|nr:MULTISPECIES: site-specific integrase [Acinetobacter calcoaceticus/baumannii complex]MBJ9545590.1 site-specific integrase [Acinetobacter baumannii]MCH2070586.1 site-specific integrase [Acinetobacter pittii]NMR37882.1 site-specific integrase [Acinetobacter baumannii]
MEQFDLFEDSQEQHSVSVFNDRQMIALQDLDKKIPKVVKFLIADKFDDKFINSTNNIWKFYYSGQTEKLDFSIFSENETTLAKFFLIAFVQKNTPSFLSRKIYSFNFLINYLKNRNLHLNYENLKKLLIEIALQENHQNTYAHIKFLLRLLILEDFPNFDIEDDFELEFIPRPKSFNSNLFYQEYEDTIDYPLISMIQQGFIKLNQGIKDNFQSIDNQELLYSSILGLVYVTGLRPVQLTKLSVQDIKVDTTRTIDQFHRYSVLIPYAKQARYVHEKIAVKLPEEIAEIILSYIERFNLYPDEKLFDMGENAARFCSKAINTQLFAFSPKSYRDAVLAGEMIRQKYSFSDFRHHVGYSLAMAGSSAEEIAYILGHSSVVTARHYIFSTPQLAQIRAQALGRNSLYKHMIAMLLTGRLVYKQEWKHKKVMGNIGHKIHYDIGGCSYNDKCLFQPVRNCYGCIYFHPFIDANHTNVLESIQCEINDLIRLSDGIGVSRNPLIRVHESTKFEIESVIVRCKIQKDGI